MKPAVSLVACATYDQAKIKEAIVRALEPFGGIAAHVHAGQTVLLKPNMLTGAVPERAITTHPALFEAVAELCLEQGATVRAGDCSGYGTLGDPWGRTGLGEVADRLGVERVRFADPVPLEPHASSLYRRIEVARPVIEADVLINLPKMKTHCQMLLTGAVKNLFGCILGARKPQWHMKSGGEAIHFGMMLAELSERLAPALTIVDGVVGMEGDGPARGTPRRFGVVLAGPECVAVDAIIARLLGVDPTSVPVLVAAERLGIGGWDPEQIDLHGDPPEKYAVHDLLLPRMQDLQFIPQPTLKRLLRSSLVDKPVIDHPRCTLCNDCVEVCPTDVMKISDGRLAIDYAGCISCYLCEAFCPESAIAPRTGLLGRLLIHAGSPRL